METTQTLIIGAGLSGLHTAQLLKKRKHSCLILEKSRGLGGRLATRRIEGKGFDHGIPFIPSYVECINLIESYSLKEEMQVSSFGITINGGMNRLPKRMGEGLNIEKNCKVVEIQKSSLGWIVKSEEGRLYEGQNLIITAPLPQALELLNQNKLSSQLALDVRFTKALMLLFTSEKISPGSEYQEMNGCSLLSLNHRKTHDQGYILQADAVLSEDLFPLSDEEALKKLLTLLKDTLGEVAPKNCELKRWRYVQPEKALPNPYVEVHPRLFLIGDAFNNPGIRGSLASAEAIASVLAD